MQNFQALGAPPPEPRTQPPLRISACASSSFVLFMFICVFVAFEQFFLDRSMVNLMMLSTDVCLMLDCFLFEKFYLHYALWTLILFCDTALIYLFAKV